MVVAGAGIIWGHFLWARYRLKWTDRHDVLKFRVSVHNLELLFIGGGAAVQDYIVYLILFL